MFSEFIAINLAWPNLFIFPNPSVFHMPSTSISSCSQTEEATPEKLMKRKGMNGEKAVEMAITRLIIKVLPQETNMGPDSLICCTFISNQLKILSNFPLILWLTAYLDIFYFVSNTF